MFKKIGLNLIVLFISSVLGIGLVEVGLRVLGVSYPSLFDLDVDRGNAFHPGASGWIASEGNAFVRINSHGLRDDEHDFAKPANTLRLAVLGDSYTSALQVSADQAYWAVLEAELAACPGLDGRAVEAINFGIDGHGTAQELITLRRDVWQYDPDIVLLGFYTANDVRNNARALEGSAHRPYFVFDGDRLILDDSFRTLPDFAADRVSYVYRRNDLINASRALQVLRMAYNRWRAGTLTLDVEPGAADGAEAGLDDAVLMAPRDPEWIEAWRVTEELLRIMNDEVRSRGARLWIAVLSRAIQVDPDPSRREAFRTRLGIEDLTYADRRIAAVAARESIPVVTLVEPLGAYAEAHRVYLHGFEGQTLGAGHWNVLGHRLAGEILAERICASL